MTYKVIDLHTGAVVWSGKTRRLANLVRDRRDNRYGGYRYQVRIVN